MFPAIDGTFVFISINSADSTNSTTNFNDNFINPSEFTSKIYASFIKPNELTEPFLIYQTAIPNLDIMVYCDSAFTGTNMMVCMLTLKRLNYKDTYLKVSFYSSGFVIIFIYLFIIFLIIATFKLIYLFIFLVL